MLAGMLDLTGVSSRLLMADGESAAVLSGVTADTGRGHYEMFKGAARQDTRAMQQPLSNSRTFAVSLERDERPGMRAFPGVVGNTRCYGVGASSPPRYDALSALGQSVAESPTLKAVPGVGAESTTWISSIASRDVDFID